MLSPARQMCQADGMARGWESKSVESQMELAEERQRQIHQKKISAEEIARQRERDGIELSRERVKRDLETAVNPGYREMLQKSLAFLDAKLAGLE